MSVEYDASKDNWWLSVGHSPVGDVHRSLTNKLMRDRWIACLVLENARCTADTREVPWAPIEVHISKNGEYQSTDVI
jgi:hypothetical protein